MKAKILNAVMFQVGWWACVLGAAKGWPLAGPVVAAMMLAVHFAYQKTLPSEWKFIAATAVAGFLIDSGLGWFGVLGYGGGWLAPLWLVCLWALVAMTVNHSISWLAQNRVLAGVFGVIGGPLAYYGGAQFGALSVSGWWGLAVLAVVWGAVVPGMFAAGERLGAGARG